MFCSFLFPFREPQAPRKSHTHTNASYEGYHSPYFSNEFGSSTSYHVISQAFECDSSTPQTNAATPASIPLRHFSRFGATNLAVLFPIWRNKFLPNPPRVFVASQTKLWEQLLIRFALARSPPPKLKMILSRKPSPVNSVGCFSNFCLWTLELLILDLNIGFLVTHSMSWQLDMSRVRNISNINEINNDQWPPSENQWKPPTGHQRETDEWKQDKSTK